MSSGKLDRSGVFQPVTVRSAETNLSLPTSSVHVRKNGIEFITSNAIPAWTEMTVDLFSPGDAKKIHCTGVVVGCTGNRHSGYVVSMLFMNLTRQAQERLNMMAGTARA
jgi:hypothetical protein